MKTENYSLFDEKWQFGRFDTFWQILTHLAAIWSHLAVFGRYLVTFGRIWPHFGSICQYLASFWLNMPVFGLDMAQYAGIWPRYGSIWLNISHLASIWLNNSHLASIWLITGPLASLLAHWPHYWPIGLITVPLPPYPVPHTTPYPTTPIPPTRYPPMHHPRGHHDQCTQRPSQHKEAVHQASFSLNTRGHIDNPMSIFGFTGKSDTFQYGLQQGFAEMTVFETFLAILWQNGCFWDFLAQLR